VSFFLVVTSDSGSARIGQKITTQITTQDASK